MTSDPGLQPQRTALAWQRTGLTILLTCAATAFATLRLGILTLTTAAIVAGAAVSYLAVRHFPKGLNTEHGAAHAWPTLAATVTVVMANALAGTALAVTHMIMR